MERVLIAEDDPRLALHVEGYLRDAGYATRVVRDRHAALEAGPAGCCHMLVLDLALLGASDLIRRLRAQSSNPAVIALSAPDEAGSAARALDEGADDLVTKPFSAAELLDRVRVELARRGRPVPLSLKAGDAALDLQSRIATIDGRSSALSPREFAVADILFRNAGRTLTREQLLAYAWSYDFEPRSNVVDVYVGYLRRKLGRELIRTVRGAGYRLEAG